MGISSRDYPTEISNEAVIKDRYIEDDLKLLAELDAQIAELISQRHERIDMIKAQQDKNRTRIQNHDDWFEGSVRCNPVPDRGEDSEFIPGYNGDFRGRR